MTENRIFDARSTMKKLDELCTQHRFESWSRELTRVADNNDELGYMFAVAILFDRRQRLTFKMIVLDWRRNS